MINLLLYQLEPFVFQKVLLKKRKFTRVIVSELSFFVKNFFFSGEGPFGPSPWGPSPGLGDRIGCTLTGPDNQEPDAPGLAFSGLRDIPPEDAELPQRVNSAPLPVSLSPSLRTGNPARFDLQRASVRISPPSFVRRSIALGDRPGGTRYQGVGGHPLPPTREPVNRFPRRKAVGPPSQRGPRGGLPRPCFGHLTMIDASFPALDNSGLWRNLTVPPFIKGGKGGFN